MTQIADPLFLLKIGVIKFTGKQSSIITVVHSPSLQSLSLYAPSLERSVCMKMFNRYSGLSISEQTALRSQQFPK